MKTTIIAFALLCSFGSIVFASSQDNRLNELVNQLNGKTCKYEIQGNAYVNRSPFASFLRRNDKEQCIIDAAKALGMMGSEAGPAVPALIEALALYHNVDSGDGILIVRSEIALALGQIGDSSAIKPLISILTSDDPVTLSSSASVPSSYKLIEKTSHGAVAEALGMFGPEAKEAAIYIARILKYSDDNYYLKYALNQAAKALGQIRSVDSIPPLIEALNNPICRADAAEALGNFGAEAKEALPVLENLMNQQQNDLKMYELGAIKDAIKKIRR